MRSFLTLVGFEYKKIFKRKSTVIALVLGTVIIIISPLMIFFGTSYIDGEPFENHYDAMLKDRAYAMALSGRALDETLLAETRDAYSKIPLVERYGITPEYQQFARPYRGVFVLMDWAFSLDMEGVRALTENDLLNYYEARHEKVTANIRTGTISDAAKNTLITLDSEIDTPFVYAYTGGFDNLFGGIYTIGVLAAFILAICLAPMFACEYGTHTDQLILSTKLGKGKLISAKLFTALSLFLLFFALLIVLALIVIISVYGFDGANAPFQLIMPFLAYPLTMLQAVSVLSLCAFAGTFLIVTITLLLSSLFKSPFGVIIAISVLLFVPMMIHVPETMVRLHNLFSLLPANMMLYVMVFSHVPFEFFGLVVLPYIAIPIFAILAGTVMLPFAWRGFRNHQIG